MIRIVATTLVLLEVAACTDSGSTSVTTGVHRTDSLTIDQGFTVERVIPVRVVQFTDSSSSDDALTDAELDTGISEMNTVFLPAGVQFYIRAKHEVVNSVFTHTRQGVSFTWPSPTSSAAPVAFNPGCSLTPPSGGSEEEVMALFRAGSYCAADGEIVLFLVESLKDATTANPPNGCGSGGCTFNYGAFPWEGNAVILMRSAFNAGVRQIIGHEFGHYLGLPHPFKGASSGYDLTAANSKNLQTGGQALSLFWDLVYKPGTSTVPHTFFTSQSAAAAFESQLVPIQNQSIDGTMCGPTVTAECPSGSDGKLFLTVNTTGSRPEDYVTGDSPLNALGFTYPSGTPTKGINIMSYPYVFKPGSGPSSGPELRRYSLSASQIAQVKRSLAFDVASSWFSGTTGRRSLLGLGAGTWSSWESLGGPITDMPAVAARLGTANRIDLVVRGTDGANYNKVLQSGGWWPSQTGFQAVGTGGTVGSPALGVRSSGALDLVVRGSDAKIYNKVWNTDGNWWPSQTGFAGPLGTLSTVVDGPTLGERSNGNVDVAVKTSDGNMQFNVWSAATSTWSGWGSGGSVAETPTICESGDGLAYLFRRNTSGNAAVTAVSGSTVGSWTDLGGGGSLAATPAAVSWAAGRRDVVAVQTSGTSAFKAFEGSWWPGTTSWSDLGGSNLVGKPAITSWGTGRLDFVARGADGALRYMYYSSTTGWWPGTNVWAVLGGDAASDPVIVTWGTNRLDVFVRGTDGMLWHRARTN